MKKFLIALLISITGVLYAQPPNKIDVRSKGSTIYGRAWYGNVPLSMGYVFVTDPEIRTLYGECLTSIEKGENLGSFSIEGLPANRNLKVFIFSDNIPGNVGFIELSLGNNEMRKVVLDLDTKFKDPGFIAKGIPDEAASPGAAGVILLAANLANELLILLSHISNIEYSLGTLNQLKALKEKPTSGSDLIKTLKPKNSSIPNLDLIAYFPFNGNANDESGNGHNGRVYNSLLTADRHGNINSAYSLDGHRSLIELEYIPISINDFSISFWAYTKSNPGGSDVYMSNDNTVNGFDLYQHFDKSIYFTVRNPSNEVNVLACPFGPERLNKWNHIVVTSENGLLKLYINNSLIGSKSGSSGVASTFKLGAGFEPSANNNVFNGYLDDIRIYNRVLREQEILTLYKE